ncbi:UNVERIFIED_CONTAM: hypothetical protein K2H54_067825 [Gekko kuhli]
MGSGLRNGSQTAGVIWRWYSREKEFPRLSAPKGIGERGGRRGAVHDFRTVPSKRQAAGESDPQVDSEAAEWFPQQPWDLFFQTEFLTQEL